MPNRDPDDKTALANPSEIDRLESLISCGLLDTPSEERFDRITRLAQRLFGVPIALVSLVDLDRQWFKSAQGLDACQTPRSQAFCAHTIKSDDVMVVEDACLDPRFRDNPLVTGEPKIRFYAGAPLVVRENIRLGTLCIIDTEPRTFGDDDREALADLSRIVVSEITLTNAYRDAENTRQLMHEAVEAVPDGFVIYDADDRLVLCNRKYKEIYADSAPFMTAGTSFEEVVRAGLAAGQYPEAAGQEEEWLAERMLRHRHPSDPIQQRLPNGRWLRIMETRTESGATVGFRVDITELKMREAQLKELLVTDSLTGAMTRREILSRTEEEVQRSHRYGAPVSVIYFDVDHFKKVNDTHGHAMGDKALAKLAKTVRSEIRNTDMFGRLGGEEFMLLLPETLMDDAASLAERIRRAVESTMIRSGNAAISITVSAGVAQLAPKQAATDLLAEADDLLYQAKNSGRNRVCTQNRRLVDAAE